MNEVKIPDVPLISIALCTYNGARFIEEQLRSLLDQTYPNIEIVVVDDCSTDDTLKIIDNFRKEFNRIRVYANKENVGYIKNFESAIKRCKADLIAIADQDDIWSRDKISLLYEHLNDNILIYHDSAFVDQNGRSLNKVLSDVLNLYKGNDSAPFIFSNCLSGHSILMRKELLRWALPFPEGYYYDQWLGFVATTVGKINYIGKSLVCYRQHVDNSTDLLRTKASRVNRKKGTEKLLLEYEWLKHCSDLELKLNTAGLATRLMIEYRKRKDSYISLSYALLYFRERKRLLYIRKSKPLGRINLYIKQLWGLKLKKLLA